jgi:hypothetical protein
MEDALDHDTGGQEVVHFWKKLHKLVASKAGLPGLHLLLAMLHERRGNWSEALQAYERFILVSPTTGWTQKALVRIHELAPPESATCPNCHAAP